MNELLTVTEVAKKLRVNHTTVRRWITEGSIEAIVLPHQNKRQAYRIKQTTLDDILSGKMFPLADTPHDI
jgi:excisionase family DNA binding protein